MRGNGIVHCGECRHFGYEDASGNGLCTKGGSEAPARCDSTCGHGEGKAKKSANIYSTLGASNHAESVRARHDLYCTHPKATEELLKIEDFGKRIWEPCDGLGHISGVLEAHGHEVRRSDIMTRGRGIEQLDFLGCNEAWEGDIVTNPPYSAALPMIRKALDVVADGGKVAMWLRILFLEGKARQVFFREYPPCRVWVSSSRIPCARYGDKFGASAVCFAWFVWEKGYKGETVLNWF